MSDQTHAAAGHDDAHHGVGHIVPVRYLVATGIALLVLTFITVAASWIEFGEADIYIALFIAGIKAALVVLFFMHLWWDRPFNSFIFVASMFFVLLFIGLALTDTIAYEPELIPGNAVDVDAKLTELQLAAPATE